jgi:hypothetical protein
MNEFKIELSSICANMFTGAYTGNVFHSTGDIKLIGSSKPENLA